MIRYSLICDSKHRFDSWFASAAAFEALRASGHLACAVCGSSTVQKAVMAPNVRSSDLRADRAETAAPTDSPAAAHPLSAPASPAEQALAELRRKIEANSDYVGRDFTREARAIHSGEAPERSIHGEANAREARGLIEDGIPIMPLPFASRRKSN